jgi:hypothetical protein
MAIALDSATNGGSVTPGTSLTFSHTCSGDNRLLLVFIKRSGAITSVTYNSDLMSVVASAPFNSDYGDLDIYGLLNPDTGTHDVVINLNNNYYCQAVSASYTGVKQTGLPNASDGSVQGTAGVSLTDSVTPTLTDCWVMGTGIGPEIAASTGMTQRGIIASGIVAGDSNGMVSPLAEYSMTVTGSGAYKLSIVMISVAAVESSLSLPMGGYIFISS